MGFERKLEQLHQHSAQASYAARRAALQQRCCQASMLAVLCFDFAACGASVSKADALRSLTHDDVKVLLSNLLRARYLKPCISPRGSDEPTAAHADTWERAQWVATRVHAVVVHHVRCNPALLSLCVRAVFSSLPSGLRWQAELDVCGCFTAQASGSASGGASYAVNVLTGTALRNGAAPAQLPAAVLHHALYKRTFGTLEFEVSDDLRSRQPHEGCFYGFQLSDGHLVVTEQAACDHGTEELELLPGVTLSNPWHLPSCLQHTAAAVSAHAHLHRAWHDDM